METRNESLLGRERVWSAVEKSLLGLTFGCFALMALAISGVSLDHLFSGQEDLTRRWTCLAISAAVVAAAALCCKVREDGRWFAPVWFLVTLALKGVFAAAVDTQPISDFAQIYHAAQSLAQTGASLTDQTYFQMWPYQSGMAVYMAALIRLFGADVLFFRLTNALYAALTSVLVYALARRFASERAARGAAVLYTLYPGTWLLIPLLTNQHLSELLLVLAVYLYTAPERGLRTRLGLAAAAGAILALGNAIRPVAVVALAAAGCLMVLEMLRKRPEGWRAARDALVRFALFALAYAVLMWGLGGMLRVTGVNQYGLGNSCPEWKFVCGLNESTGGRYSQEDASRVFAGEDSRAMARELMLERIKMPPARLFSLFGQKIHWMWGSFETLTWILTPNVLEIIGNENIEFGTRQVKDIQFLSSGFYILCFLLAAAGGAAALMGRPGERETARMLALVALAYFGVHLFIEIQMRYRSLMLVVAFPLIAAGIDGMSAFWKKRRKPRSSGRAY